MSAVAAVESAAKVLRPRGTLGANPRADVPLADFTKGAWHIVEPRAPLMWNWHHDAICDYLTAASNGQILRLIITIPPRTSKSTLLAVMWNAWEWTFAPYIRWLVTSHSQRLATRDSVHCRTIIESPWYQRRWGSVYQLAEDQNQKTRYSTTMAGVRISGSILGGLTGEGGDRVIVDDPHDAEKVESDLQRNKVIDRWDAVMSTRGNDPRTAVYVISGQRTHDKDLVGHILAQESGYEHLDIPQEFDGRRKASVLGWTDPRTKHGALLHPARHDAKHIAQQKRSLGTYRYAAQHQQLPSPKGGGIFKRADFKRYKARDLPGAWVDISQSWDMAFKGEEDSSFVVGQAWGISGVHVYLLGTIRRQMEFPATVRSVLELTKQFPTSGTKLVEEKANGAAVISTLRERIPGLVAIKGNDDKPARARAVSWFVEGGGVLLPDEEDYPEHAAMVKEFLDELERYPKSTYTDQAIAFTQFLHFHAIAFILAAQEASAEQPAPVVDDDTGTGDVANARY